MSIQAHCNKCKSDYTYKSKKCPGCGATNDGQQKSFRVVVRQEGKRITRVVPNLALAKELEMKFKIDIIRGEQAISRKKPALTLDDVWKKYLPWAKENKKSWQTDKSYYEHHIKPSLGNKRLDSISPFDIEKLLVSMKKENNRLGHTYKAATIKHQVVLLNRLYVLAGQWRLYAGNNPCHAVKKPKLNNEITEFLSDDIMAGLNKVLIEWPDKVIASLVRFAMVTGIRRGELLKLQWQDVDLEHKYMCLYDPKGKANQTLPLSNEAIKILKDTPREYETTWIFYGQSGKQHSDFREQWNSIKKAAGLPKDFRFHGLRHNFASHLVSNGTDLYTVSKLLTHKSTAVTQRYAHLADGHLREAVNKAGTLLSEKQDKQNKETESTDYKAA
jgi:integrase